jgi:diguanylate cyclase
VPDDPFRRRVASGDVLFREGERSDCAYLIEEGRLEVSVERDGTPHVLAEMRAGSLIGEMALIDNGTRTATVRALEDTVLTRVERGHLEKRLESADPLLRHMLDRLIGRYRDVVRRLDVAPAPKSVPELGSGQYRALATRTIKSGLALEQALERDQFVLHYQPIMRLGDHSIAGFEALIRWLHPERGLVSPDDFIPVAEDSGLIVEIGRWVARTAVAALAQLDLVTHESAVPLFMTVNLSGRQLKDNTFSSVLEGAIRQHKLDASRVRLEITESALFDRIDDAEKLLHQCTDLGVGVAVDDFGTGYSALSYLYRLPVSCVKLARPFIKDLAEYPQTSKIVSAVSRLARELQMETVAEGVEKVQQASAVRDLGIEYGQGFFYAAALPLMVAARYTERTVAGSFQRERSA